MLYWSKYISHKSDILGKRKLFDNNIYTFDIETTSYIVLDGKQYKNIDYLNFTEDEKERCEKKTTMYIWMFSINDIVYYGRTWEEFKMFLYEVNKNVPELKIVFVHNLAFEFQFLIGEFKFTNVVARKSHKVMYADMQDMNFQFRCSYFMSNCRLEKLPELYNLPVEKLVGNLDYSEIRHSKTKLSEKELAYCENDCLVVYEYIKFELKTYGTVKDIPKTSTGHVRRELQELTRPDYKYRRIVSKAVNTNPVIYNRLQEAFMGGYTHSSYMYTDEVLYKVKSYDETSAYPYVMVTYKFPSTEFRQCNIDNVDQMSNRLAYLLVVKFKNIKSNYYNSFISSSKCRNIKNANYDNGRIMSADELEITLTDVDFRFILDTHKCQYEILESYVSVYNYLPKQYINFILDKYVRKTQFKNVAGKEIEYQLEKGKFNSLYGMSVTNTIRDNVIFSNDDGWSEEELSNEEIEKALLGEKKKGFLSFAYGVWVTAWARNNLLRRVVDLDDYVVYCDTDSIKLVQGYNENIIKEYNKTVINRIKLVSSRLKIDEDRFHPKDKKGIEHWLGIFDDDGMYEEFITQGAKKYAVTELIDKNKCIDEEGNYIKNVIKEQNDKCLVLNITVAGVPKKAGSKALKSLDEFRDDFVFRYEDTNKLLLMYIDKQEPFLLTDKNGVKYEVKDKTGCVLLPTTYILGKAIEYANLVSDSSSNRSVYKEMKK